MKRVGITPAQCALGFRTGTLMHRIGVNKGSFIVDVYNRCKYIGLLPENNAFHLGDLLEFSKIVPLSNISDYVE